MTAKHSPLPWQASKGVNKTVGQFIWRNNGDEANTGYVRICRNVATEADAAFIVQACNSHEALLEALKEIAARGPVTGYGSADALRLRLVATQSIARAAIQAAGGER